MALEALIKGLSDEVENFGDTLDDMRNARNTGRRALELEAEATVQVTLAKIHARIAEIRKAVNL